MKLWKKIPLPVKKLANIADESRRQIFAFGVVLFINFPLYYIIWLHTAKDNFDNLPLRLVASLLCIPLILNKQWPQKALHWLTLYWYFTALYCLPFFFTFMLLKNNADTLWLMNIVSATFFILLLFEVIVSLSLLLIGSFAGYVAFILSDSTLYYPPEGAAPSGIIATLIAAIIIGSIFSRNKQLIEEIRRRSIKAEENSRAKTEFLANMSHDIRTPLTGIIGLSEFLKEKLTNKENQESASMIYLSGTQLLNFLNEVLEVISLDAANDNNVEKKTFDVVELMQDLIQLENPAASSRHLLLEKNIDKNIPRYVIGDKMKLHRILLNLIGNAIKFTEKGSVELAATLLSQDDKAAIIRFSVKDTGIGIPKKAQKNIFDCFYKVIPSYKGKYIGNGIGLHIVRKYVKLLGGEINFCSEEKKGTVFSVTLTFPLGTKPLQIEEKNYSPSKELPRIEAILPPTNTVEESLVPNKMKVLLVEDNKAALMGLQCQMREFPIAISEAMDGEGGLELIKKHRFDLIITDIGLPGISGDEMVREARVFEREIGRAPSFIIALTGHATAGSVGEKLMEAGINEIYQKPMLPEMLRKILKPLLEISTNISNQVHTTTSLPTLGLDLPATEEQLFEIGKYALLDLEVGAKALGSEELVKEILVHFKKEGIDPDLENIKKARLANDWDTVGALTHKIKGGATFGTVRLYYALLFMERYLKAGHKRCAEQLYEQMMAVIEETTAYLEKNL